MTAEVRANLSTAWAPAKVNLYLHVGPPKPGGLHPVDSLVVFADTRAADRVSAQPSPNLTLNVEGPNARALKNAPNNLVLAAAQALRDACGRTGLGASLTLHKVLPIAAGVGGGSADAAAALIVLNEMWGVRFGEQALEGIAAQLGADVPACVRRRPVLMRGAGEKLIDVSLPDMPAVLVNCGAMLETRKVFAKYDQMGPSPNFSEIAPPSVRGGSGELLAFVQALKGYRNDLEAASKALCKDIEKVLVGLRSQPGCLLARMSGSGATCFGIFETEAAAEAAVANISARKRNWWVRATVFRGGA
jgi:4-diphosphocytidyl-2-C-methyl-D-erythritol kinase